MCSRTTDLYKLTTIALLLRLNSKAIVQSVRPCLCVRGSSYLPTAAPAVSFTGGWQVVFVLDGRVGVTPLDVEIARWLHRQSLLKSSAMCCARRHALLRNAMQATLASDSRRE